MEKNLELINIKKPKHVHQVVDRNLRTKTEVNSSKIKKIEYLGKEKVYNMEVEDYHNFSVNGGLIIHNCIDSIRYATEELGNKTDLSPRKNKPAGF